MKKKLVIVESPAKAKTMARLLGNGFSVKASIGHVRDLPKGKLGVDVENGFAPSYLVPREKKAVVRELKEAARGAPLVYLATDPDREGEAIAWHLVQAAELDKVPVRRVVLHEITKEAIDKALRHPRAIDIQVVNAQQARRILDRLVGYKISPLLWRKVRRGLSAGRVQSVTLRMVVDREHEIENFIPVEYWSIEAELEKQAKSQSFRASLVGFLGSRRKLEVHNEEETGRFIAELKQAAYAIAEVHKKEAQRQPAPPFMTSTLQQEAWRNLHFTAKRTMAIAQQLYEGLPIGEEGRMGLITYMRTDSTRVASSALSETRAYIADKYGAEFVPGSARIFAKKVKGAQEAHEAIRPTSVKREPMLLKPYLDQAQLKLYELIWKRMVASQMSAARLDNTTVDIGATRPGSKTGYLLRAKSSVIKFPGFLILYSQGGDEAEERKHPLPKLSKGESLKLLGLFPEQHFTQPPPRYTEATLVKALEENGIGRPSTYAPILSTIQERDYVQKIEGRFKPMELGLIVNELLTKHFTDIVDIGFTAQMEEGLDEIARGQREWAPMLQEFYTPFEKMVERASDIPKIKMADEPTNETCKVCGQPMVIKLGRYGKFLACTGYPECKHTRPFLVTIGVRCPQCGAELVEKRAKKKRTFYGCANFPNCDFAVWERPLPQPCPNCGGLLLMPGKKTAKCSKCGYSGQVAGLAQPALVE